MSSKDAFFILNENKRLIESERKLLNENKSLQQKLATYEPCQVPTVASTSFISNVNRHFFESFLLFIFVLRATF